MKDRPAGAQEPPETPGSAFEKLTAAIQRMMDPNAAVAHDVWIVDRIGQRRQFDVVVTGKFGGQDMLGVIECKDYSKKVGIGEVDAFITKSNDVNASFKVLVARRGFTRSALEKCAHHKIQALSLLIDDPANQRFFVGSYWDADVVHWDQLSVALLRSDNAPFNEQFKVEAVSIGGKRVLDWFTNYLLEHGDEFTGDGWILDFAVVFNEPQLVAHGGAEPVSCAAISFKAQRARRELQRAVGVAGPGFFNWNAKEATFPAGATIASAPVPLDFEHWEPRRREGRPKTGHVEVMMEVHMDQFQTVPDAIDLESLGELAQPMADDAPLD